MCLSLLLSRVSSLQQEKKKEKEKRKKFQTQFTRRRPLVDVVSGQNSSVGYDDMPLRLISVSPAATSAVPATTTFYGGTASPSATARRCLKRQLLHLQRPQETALCLSGSVNPAPL
ncbi:nucleotide-diphospho-sugar transferase superfamily protein [Striga asiatica]|uniref:Nucleotide-diphospho-sugar transferase superfamily protein n=1 Tax=Striga asiatica TaxID=4170 RepID=A0A5A7QYL1_STRAF|nr:nucleotide-diphospho-sugar transferase superfamily protein [Striga asiatica]